MLQSGQIPHTLKRTKMVAILKPGKPNDSPQKYSPVALLSVMYKLVEYNMKLHDQVTSLTTFIEAGYQKKLKICVAFIDLSVSYKTV